MDRRAIVLWTVTALAAALVALPAGAAADQVPPPGSTGCIEPLTVSDQDPSAGLPTTMRYRRASRLVNLRLRAPTQATRVEISAFPTDGRRVDTRAPGEYTCTTPGETNYIAFGVRPRVPEAILRSGRARLRVRFLMVNATGRATTLRRSVTVVLQQEEGSAATPVQLAARPVLLRTARGARLHFAFDRPADRITARIAGRPARIRTIGGPGSGVYGASVRADHLQPGRRYLVTLRAVRRLGGATERRERLFLHGRWPASPPDTAGPVTGATRARTAVKGR